MPRGGKVLAEGAYGCVVSPSPKCSTTSSPKNTVAKLFAENDLMDEEYTLAKEVAKIDPSRKWSIPVYGKCQMQVKELAKEDREGCTSTKKMYDDNFVSYMVMDYGGTSLDEYVANRVQMDITVFCSIFETCLSAIHMMHKAGFMHLDIKPGNILYNASTKKCYLIDFSLMRKMDHRFYTEEHEYLFSARYPWYPPEFPILERGVLFNYYDSPGIKSAICELYDRAFAREKIKIFKPLELGTMAYEILDFIDALKRKKNPNVWSIMNSQYNEMLPKVDVFSLGLTMLYVYRTCVDVKARIGEVEDILIGMISGNVFTRITTSAALDALRKTAVPISMAARTPLHVSSSAVAPKTPSPMKRSFFTKLFKKK